jgi:hypothetical protein
LLQEGYKRENGKDGGDCSILRDQLRTTAALMALLPLSRLSRKISIFNDGIQKEYINPEVLCTLTGFVLAMRYFEQGQYAVTKDQLERILRSGSVGNYRTL